MESRFSSELWFELKSWGTGWRSSPKFGLLYHFIQFSSHASRVPSKYRNVTVVTATKVDLPKLFSVTNLYAQFFVASSSRLPKFFAMSWPPLVSAETKILVGLSRVTMPAKLNEMVQYLAEPDQWSSSEFSQRWIFRTRVNPFEQVWMLEFVG